jgi:23S rRNA G2069 N7-methylase RlmK/C1962 C5-methylase RlmI
MTDKLLAQAEMLENRLRKRCRHLAKWAQRTGTEAYRLYDRDIPEIPLLLDRYGNAVSGALYQRPYEKAEDEEAAWLSAMKAAAARALAIDEDRIFLKLRHRQKPGQKYTARNTPALVTVSENAPLGVAPDAPDRGLQFRVDLAGNLDTGLFLDSRKMRARLRAEAADKKVLNLFCYTAAFSVYARAGGAALVDSVDMSNSRLAWAGENFRLNGFDPAGLQRADVLRFVEDARRQKRKWDIIILDPPAFSNSKKMTGTLDTRRDHPRLITQCLALLAPGGVLYFSAKAKGFVFDNDTLPAVFVKDITAQIRDEDFAGRRIPLWYQITAH